MSTIWKIVRVLTYSILGVLIASQFNIFELKPLNIIVPDEYSYEICITAYFTLLDIILESIFEWLKRMLFSELEVIISDGRADYELSGHVSLVLDENYPIEAHINVRIRGKKSSFKGVDLVIEKPPFVEFQCDSQQKAGSMINDNYHINLESLFGNLNHLESFAKHEFKLPMMQDPLDGESEMQLNPVLRGKYLRIKSIKYKHNETTLKAVNR